MAGTGHDPSNGRVIAIAGAAAGAVAAVVAALDRADQERGGADARHRAASMVRELTGAEGEVRQALSAAGGEAARLADGLTQARERLAVDGRDALRSAEAALGGRMRRRGGRGMGRAGAAARDVRRRGAEEGQAMTERVTEAAQRAGEQTAATAQLIAEQAAATAAAGAERVREASTALADAAKERAPQVAQRVAEVRERVPQVSQRVADVARERAPQVSQKVAEVAKERVPQATQRVTDEVVPTLRDVAFHAASLAVDLWQAARDRAADAADVAQSEIGHQAAEAVATGSERAREATAAVAARVADVEERAKEASAAVVERASEATERAKTATKHAASATVETGKETGAMLFWAGAAAGILFYALLDKNRREQLTKTVKSITAQAQELIKDFQGYDEELGASS